MTARWTYQRSVRFYVGRSWNCSLRRWCCSPTWGMSSVWIAYSTSDPPPSWSTEKKCTYVWRQEWNTKWKKANKQLLMSNIRLCDRDPYCVRATEGENGCCYWIGITSNQSDRWVLERPACFHVADGLECECAYWSGRGAMFDGVYWNARCVFINGSIDSASLTVCLVSVWVGCTYLCHSSSLILGRKCSTSRNPTDRCLTSPARKFFSFV